MCGVFLPGNSTTDLRELPDPEPGAGQVLLAMRASTICGSDIRAIYREHAQGDPAEMYQGVVAGHEPAGEVVSVGPGAVRLRSATGSACITSAAAGSATRVSAASRSAAPHLGAPPTGGSATAAMPT